MTPQQNGGHAPPSTPPSNSTCRTLLYALFGLSGFCALVFEILWMRHLSLAFGTTMVAVSTVTATFMGGLALGNLLLGRLVDRSGNPLRIYSYLEAGVALSGLLFPWALDLTTAAYIQLTRALPAEAALSTAFYFLFSSLLLLPPAICMGGTFPVMCRAIQKQKPGGEVGRLYAVNTLGATLGVFFSGFFLIHALGLTTTARLAIGLNLGIAIVSYILSRRGKEDEKSHRLPTTSEDIRPSPLHPSGVCYPFISIALIGAFSLAYEILWTRSLLLFLGSTIYAFSIILSIFLVGIAAGGALAASILRKSRNQEHFFILFVSLMGLYVLVTLPYYDRLSFLFQGAHEIAQGRWPIISTLSFAIVALVMIPPTVFSGALLPLAVSILNPSSSHGGAIIGRVVMWNTLGAILGSLTAGFFMTPYFGLQKAIWVVAFCNLMLALALYIKLRKAAKFPDYLPAVLAAGLALTFFQGTWDQKLMNSGVYYYAYRIEDAGGLRPFLQSQDIIDVVDGVDATVAVKKFTTTGDTLLAINGKTDASSGIHDMVTQLLLGHLPMLLHPNPEKALVIGLGSGITLGATAGYPMIHIDCVEISKAVVSASSHFAAVNGQALADPRVRIVVQDARNFLLTRTERYDVIISEPSNPWQSGNANLFTTEFYTLVEEHLTRDGVFCQWLPLYDSTPENLRIICQTFLKHFPRAMAFLASGRDLLLVGSGTPLLFDYMNMKARMGLEGGREALALIGMDTPGRLIGKTYLFSEEALMKFSREAPISTDDRPRLEFSYREIFQPKILQQNLDSLHASLGREKLPLVNPGERPEDVKAALIDLGEGYVEGGRVEHARYFLELARRY